MAVRVHFIEAMEQDIIRSNGWADEFKRLGYIQSVEIGKNCSIALNRVRGASNLDAVKHVIGEDLPIHGPSAGRRVGDYRFKGFKILVRNDSNHQTLVYVNFVGPIESFEELALMLENPEFTTDWFGKVERRPVGEWEAAKRPTLSQRLAARSNRRQKIAT